MRGLLQHRVGPQRRGGPVGEPGVRGPGGGPREADVDVGQVAGGGPQQRERPGRYLADVLHVGEIRGQAAEQLEPAAHDDPRGGLGGDVEDALDPAVVAVDRRVGEREVALLQEPGPLQRQQRVLHPGRPGPVEDTLQHRPDDVPGLGEDLSARPPEGTRVLLRDHLDVCLVVDEHELRSPHERDGEAGVQGQADRVAQRRAPRGRCPQRCRVPVQGRVQLAQGARVEEGINRHRAHLTACPAAPGESSAMSPIGGRGHRRHGLDLHELVLVAEERYGEQRAGGVVVTERGPDHLPHGHQVVAVGRWRRTPSSAPRRRAPPRPRRARA